MKQDNVEPKWVVLGIIALILVVGGLSIVYTVPADSEGVILRFGKWSKTVEPGLRFKLPFGIDRVEIVQVERQLKQEFGFGTSGASNASQFSSPRDQPEERSMITGDRNEASVEWIVQYRIRDSRQFLFHVRRPEATLRDVSESVMREVIGDRTVDEVLTVGRQEIEDAALTKMREIVSEYGLGLGIDQVQLKNVNPPIKVQPSFNEVNQAQQEREQSINVARGEYNKEVPRARGEADQLISAAEGYAAQRTNEAEGDAERFLALLEEYKKAPEITMRRMYLETLGDVLPKLGRKIVMDDTGRQVLPLLQLPSDETSAPAGQR